MAASVAAKLTTDGQVAVKTVSGGLGEFSVAIDDRKVFDGNRFWYPKPGSVVQKIRSILAE